MLGNRLNNISADVIFCRVNMLFGWLRIKHSCEEHHRLYIMHHSFGNHCFTHTSEQDGDIMYCVFTFTLSQQCEGNVGV